MAYFLFPETKGELSCDLPHVRHEHTLIDRVSIGKTLEEIAAVFGDHNVVRPPTADFAVNELDEEKKMGDFSHLDRTDKV